MGFNNDRRGFGCASSAKTYTVEDYPLTLPDIKKLKTLSILGNSSQSGTPSPDNPIEVVGTGVRTENLFDISSLSGSNIEVKGTDIYLSGYDCSTNTSPEKFMEMTGTQQNDMITVFLKTDVIHGFSNSALGRVGFIRKKDSKVVYLNYNKQASVFTIPSDFSSENYGNMRLYGAQLADETGQRIAVVSEPAVYKGAYTAETLPNYEPYGYKVTVTASGRNLFDYEYFFKNAVNVQDSTISVVYTLEKNAAYTVYTNVPLSSAGYVSVFAITGEQYYVSTRNDGVSLGNPRVIMTDDSGRLTVHLRTIEYPNTIILTREDFVTGKYWVSLVEGAYTASTMPPYEPYKSPQSFNVYSPEVLHGVGNAHDTVILDFDKRKAELVQEVNAIKLTGSEAKLVYTNANVPILNGYYIANILPQRQNKAKYISTVFNPEIEKTNSLWVGYSNNKHIFCIVSQFYNDESEDKGLSNFNAFLKQQYDSGNPATIYYDNSRYEPTTTDITSLQDWDALPRLKGTWILSATGGTEPTLKAAYTSNTDPYPDYSNIVSVLPIYPDLDITEDDPTSEGVNTEETEDQPETTSTDEPNTSTDEPTSETNNSIDTIDILDLYE